MKWRGTEAPRPRCQALCCFARTVRNQPLRSPHTNQSRLMLCFLANATTAAVPHHGSGDFSSDSPRSRAIIEMRTRIARFEK